MRETAFPEIFSSVWILSVKMLLFIVHGLLHLIGYDDHTEEDIATMRAKENYYLSQRSNI